MDKKILVTGGAGYLGSWLLRLLLEQGYHVNCLDNYSYGDSSLNEIRGHSRLSLFEGDICNVRDLHQAMEGCDSVVALAAIVGDPACNLDESDTYLVNYESTKLLASICAWNKIRRLVFASSCSVYGASDNLVLNEGSHLEPVSLYSRTRIKSENVLLTHENIKPVILRLSTLFGQSHRMRYDLVLNFFSAKSSLEKKITVHGGEQFRPMVHVYDAARAILAALQAPDNSVVGEIFNVGSNDQNITIKEMAELVKKNLPEIEIEYSTSTTDKRNYKVSFDKITHLLGYSTTRGFEDGLKEMIRGAKELGSMYNDPIYYNVQYLYKK